MWMNILQFVIVFCILVGGTVFFVRKMLFEDTQKAMKRLDDETEAARTKQIELSRKLKEADEELAKRKAEADALTKKMIIEAEEKVKEEREKMIHKARAEGEEIITKAQNTKDKIRKEIELDVELKTINHSMGILNKILSEKAKGRLNQQFIEEFLGNLEKLDMSKITSDIASIELTTSEVPDPGLKDRVSQIVKTKLKRDIGIVSKNDPQIIGGITLKFGSLLLDGSVRTMIKEAGGQIKQKIETS